MTMDNDFIPTAAFVEHHVLEEAISKNISIVAASATVLPQFGLVPHGPFLHWQTRLLGMLYTLLVFPRERWKQEGLLEIVIERAKSDMHLSKTNKGRLSAGFLRSLRNAVSHARIHFDREAVTFRDGRGGAEITFEETVSKKDAVNLLLVLGRAFHESAQIKGTLANLGRKK